MKPGVARSRTGPSLIDAAALLVGFAAGAALVKLLILPLSEAEDIKTLRHELAREKAETRRLIQEANDLGKQGSAARRRREVTIMAARMKGTSLAEESRAAGDKTAPVPEAPAARKELRREELGRALTPQQLARFETVTGNVQRVVDDGVARLAANPPSAASATLRSMLILEYFKPAITAEREFLEQLTDDERKRYREAGISLLDEIKTPPNFQETFQRFKDQEDIEEAEEKRLRDERRKERSN